MTRKLAPFETWKGKLVQDEAILGGEPVFPRSRLAVRKIGSMLLKGASVDEVKEDYPFLDDDEIEFANCSRRRKTEPHRSRTTRRLFTARSTTRSA